MKAVMDDFSLVVNLVQAVIGLVLAPLLILIFVVARRRRLGAAFDRVAARLGGAVVKDPDLGETRVEFRVDGVPAALTIRHGAMRLPEWTRVRFDAGRERRWRVTPRSLGKFEPLRGGVEAPSGEAAFDRHYRIDVEPGRDLPASWRRLVAVAGQVGTERRTIPGAGLDVGPAGVTVTNYRSLMDRPRDLEAFVDSAIELFREIRGLGHPGVELAPLHIRPSGTCPVCSHDVGPDGRVCPGCTTAHHADCWDYFGGCSIYACAGRSATIRQGR